MELKLNLNYHELFSLITQLSVEEMDRLQMDLRKVREQKTIVSEKNSLTSMLLAGPTMSEAQHETFEANRKWMNQWRTQP